MCAHVFCFHAIKLVLRITRITASVPNSTKGEKKKGRGAGQMAQQLRTLTASRGSQVHSQHHRAAHGCLTLPLEGLMPIVLPQALSACSTQTYMQASTNTHQIKM